MNDQQKQKAIELVLDANQKLNSINGESGILDSVLLILAAVKIQNAALAIILDETAEQKPSPKFVPRRLSLI